MLLLAYIALLKNARSSVMNASCIYSSAKSSVINVDANDAGSSVINVDTSDAEMSISNFEYIDVREHVCQVEHDKPCKSCGGMLKIA